MQTRLRESSEVGASLRCQVNAKTILPTFLGVLWRAPLQITNWNWLRFQAAFKRCIELFQSRDRQFSSFKTRRISAHAKFLLLGKHANTFVGCHFLMSLKYARTQTKPCTLWVRSKSERWANASTVKDSSQPSPTPKITLADKT